MRPFLTIDTTALVFQGTPTSSNLSDRSVSIIWSPATDNVRVAGHQIFRNDALVGTGSGTQFNDSGLSPSTAYSYQVLAFDAAGNQSARSAALAITTRAADTVAPSAPGAPVAGTVTASSIVLSWAASTDSYGVADYQIQRNGALDGTSTTASFVDNNSQPSTGYSYTIKAKDAAGNQSAASAATSITTAVDNVADVFYRTPSGWTTVNLHFSPTGGTWTTVPGVPMTVACSGWHRYTANLGGATGLTAVFNNGSGVWGNKGGQNYALGTGIQVVQNGAISTGITRNDGSFTF